jgi:hypothetical protein
LPYREANSSIFYPLHFFTLAKETEFTSKASIAKKLKAIRKICNREEGNMSKTRLAVGIIILLIGLFALLMFQVSFDKLVGAGIAVVGLLVLLTARSKSGSVGVAGRTEGGFQGVVRSLKKEGNVANFWLEVSGQAGRTVNVEAYVREDTVNEGDTVWVRGKPTEGATLKTSEIRNLSHMPTTSGMSPPQIGGGGTGRSSGGRALLIIGWLILSFILAFVIVIAVMSSDFMNEIFVDEESRNIAAFTILFLSFTVLQVIMYKSGALSSRRQRGQLLPGAGHDLPGGFLEATARNVKPPDTRAFGKGFNAKMHRVQRFRAELTDSQGNITQYVTVEVECEEEKWVGEIADGDKVRVQGKVGEDGILHAERALNLTTNSIVGKK